MADVQLPSTPDIGPGTQGSVDQTTYLYEFLQTLLAHPLFTSEPPTRLPSTHPLTIQLSAFVPALTEEPTAGFARRGKWDKDRALITSHSLDIVGKALVRMEDIFNKDVDLEKKWLGRLLTLVGTMEIWMERDVVYPEDSPLPLTLKEKAIDVSVVLLRTLGAETTLGPTRDKPVWKALRECLEECLETVKELLSISPPFSFPIHLTLFRSPRIHETIDDPFKPSPVTTFTITSQHQLPTYILNLLSIISHSLVPFLSSQSLLLDIHRQTVEATCELFDSCFVFSDKSPLTKTLPDILTRALDVTTELAKCDYVSVDPLEPYVSRLLIRRLREGVKEDWASVDAALQRTFATLPPKYRMGKDTSDVLNIVAQQWPENALLDASCAYLQKSLSGMSAETLRALNELLESTPATEAVVDLHKSVTTARQALSPQPPENDKMEVEMSEVDMIHKMHELLARRFFSGVSQWHEGAIPRTMGGVITKALTDLSKRWNSRALDDINPEEISSLKALPCMLSHPFSPCFDPKNRRIQEILPIMFAVAIRIMDHIPTPSRILLFDAIGMAIMHGDVSRGKLEEIPGLVRYAMGKEERSLRLAAGRAFVQLVVALHSRGDEPREDVLDQIARATIALLDGKKDSVKETTLITFGNLAKVAPDEARGSILLTLVAQLGQKNSLLKGLAYVQLLNIAKHHKKSVHSLLMPHYHLVGRYVVERICLAPSILAETCRLIASTPRDFLYFTLSHSLPPLASKAAREEIDEIAREIDMGVSQMVMEKLTEVLTYIFLLETPTDTEKGLKFVTGLVAEAAESKGGSVSLPALVKSCAVQLLSEIVMVLGEEDPHKVSLAIQALAKVERKLATGRGPRSSVGDLGAFLKFYMVGIISYLSEVLQDVQGKKSPAAKKQVIRSIGVLVQKVGPSMSSVSPQIMAAMQTVLGIEYLAETTLTTWYTFVSTLGFHEIGPYVGSTSAAFVHAWPTFSPASRQVARRTIDYLILENAKDLGPYLDEIVSLDGIVDLVVASERLRNLREQWSTQTILQKILERSTSENVTVATQALGELKQFLLHREEFVQKLASGDAFDPIIGRVVQVLFSAASRDGDASDSLRLMAFDCIGVLSALDPDRFDLAPEDTTMTVINNFTDEGESVSFAVHLIRDLLVGAFRSTSDIKHQSHLAFAIQELLSFCGFTPDLVLSGNANSIPNKVRSRWNSLPKDMLDTVAPLLEGRFQLNARPSVKVQHPIYSTTASYREWIQIWTSHLITRVSGDQARTIFEPFRLAVKSQDVEVARHLLPHLVLNVLISGEDTDRHDIRQEVVIVLEDQSKLDGAQSADKKQLCAQTVFILMDHLSKWIRLTRQATSKKRVEKRPRNATFLEEQLTQVESLMSSIDQDLMAQAAFTCKAYARALMTFEQRITTLQERKAPDEVLQGYYDRLHVIYAQLDEPDGMEGVSTKVISPSLEHQIREHESTGRWTSAQSCWEVKLQHSPENVSLHIGLLRCLRNLGHYDTLRTHIKGVITRHPGWEPVLAEFQVEGALMTSDWDAVQQLVSRTQEQTPELTLARLALAIREQDANHLSEALAVARTNLGAPITAAGPRSYRRSYDSVLNLHFVHELEMISHATLKISGLERAGQHTAAKQNTDRLTRTLSARLESTLPTFRTREPLLSMRRIAFSMSRSSPDFVKTEVGQTWLASSKLARKAGHFQTAYSAVLQAQQSDTPYSFIQSCKLLKANGETLRALQELENSLQRTGARDVIDLTHEAQFDDTMQRAKAALLRARWVNEAERFDHKDVVSRFQEAIAILEKWESPFFHLGHYYNECLSAYPAKLTGADRHLAYKYRYFVCKEYAKALQYGSKHIYQTMPRMLTLWLDTGEDEDLLELDQNRRNGSNDLAAIQSDIVKINGVIEGAIRQLPTYKWLTAFPQIVSRVGHPNNTVYNILAKLISKVLYKYPQQALWLFTSVLHSRKENRRTRGEGIINQVRLAASGTRNPVATLVNEWIQMTTQLLALCDRELHNEQALSMTKHFPALAKLAPSGLILPLQDSLTVSLPSTSAKQDNHEPFPVNVPTFVAFQDEIIIMPSMQKPRKITVKSDDGKKYSFLCKPKDDLRKDARLMDFNSMINKMLKTNSESRRRQLRIRTYGVVPLNEECGLIQWVPGTVPLRSILYNSYGARGIPVFHKALNETLDRARPQGDAQMAAIFTNQLLPMYPPVFHEWFVATFPEPTAWLASRLAYGRTAAVISIVGYILGLGDRHGENILLDSNNGDTVHVDFNCLFDKGKTFEIAERVPFRLTQNMVDGLGVTGVEGVFRIACEVTMQLLRDNQDSLMSVLEAFVHDPLVEWEDEKRKRERELRVQKAQSLKGSSSKRGNPVAEARVPQLRELAHMSLDPIQRKLKGWHVKSSGEKEPEKEVKTSNQVEAVIKEATNPANLARMYVGWMSWM